MLVQNTWSSSKKLLKLIMVVKLVLSTMVVCMILLCVMLELDMEGMRDSICSLSLIIFRHQDQFGS